MLWPFALGVENPVRSLRRNSCPAGTSVPVGPRAGSLRPGMELAGRKALLTGATGGLGRAIADAMAARGAVLLLSARSRDALEEMAKALPGDGHRVLPADLAEGGAAERLAEEA